jgi:hypothetical protein
MAKLPRAAYTRHAYYVHASPRGKQTYGKSHVQDTYEPSETAQEVYTSYWIVAGQVGPWYVILWRASVDTMCTVYARVRERIIIRPRRPRRRTVSPVGPVQDPCIRISFR